MSKRGGDIIYKLIAIDIDGTLINDNLELTTPTRQAIAQAQSQGVLVTLATGRNYYSALNYANQLNIDLPLICANGAIIRDKAGEILHEALLPRQIIAPLIDRMVDAGLFVEGYHQGGVHMVGRKRDLFRSMLTKKTPFHLLYVLREFRRVNLRQSPELSQQVASGDIQVHKLFSCGPKSILTKFHDQAVEAGLAVKLYPGHVQRTYLEVMPPQADKGSSLVKLAQHLSLPMDQVIAIGDNLNDTEMIQAAGLGVAMGNGHSRLKVLADHIAVSNDQHGVAGVIDQFILNPQRRVV